MYEGMPRRGDATEYRRQESRSSIIRHPDRIALWAVVMAVVAMVAAAASAHAGSGGTSTSAGGSDSSGSCTDQRFGARALKLGDCGDDVKTMHWIMKASSYGVPLDKEFDDPTDGSVRSFQHRHGLRTTGVVRKSTRRKLARTMPRSVATWYGPGFFGERTACGTKLSRSTVGVAHRRLPCGTRVTLKYRSHYVRARVIDRGPYTNGVRWDLTQRTARKLHMT